MIKKLCIAIDGPAAAGKSTVSKILAKKLNFTYIDTGAMYRAFTYSVLKNNLNPKDEKECVSLIPQISIELNPNGQVFCNKEDVTQQIRMPDVSSNVSYIASYKEIRLALVDQQRNMAAHDSVVMDGRDIGTYVLPNSDVKIFLVASVEERATRRYKENISKNIECSYDDIVKDVLKRDKIDSSRSFAPLKPAKDSIEVDTSTLSIDEVVEKILSIIKEKVGNIV